MKTKNQICPRLVNNANSHLAQGFTRMDLLAVTAMLLILFCVMLPALAKPGLNTHIIQCLNNHRQMCNAWRMYADDNSDRIVYASANGTRIGSSVPMNSNPNDPSNYAWTGAHLDGNPGNRANWDTNYDIVLRPLWAYTARNPSIYKCPSDLSGLNISGIFRPRVQNTSMNFYLGGINGSTAGLAFVSGYRIYFKTTELTKPGPANTFVFIDHRPDNINFGNFATDMTGAATNDPAAFNFADWPGYFHDGGAGISFADGHVEIHHWVDPRTCPALSQPGTQLPPPGASPYNKDVAWLQAHSTALQ